MVTHLFRFRNDVAHGKSIKVIVQEIRPVESYNTDDMRDFLKRRWEKYCTRKNAERAREDVERIIHILHDAAGFEDDHAFVSGFQLTSATLISGGPST